MIRVYPVAGAPRSICAGYGPRTYKDGTTKLHDACDLCAPTGTALVAVDDGVVSYGTDPTGGNVALLRSADGNGYYYAHMLDAQSGQRTVAVGEQLGRVDMTGNAQGTIPHVHFQVWPGGQFNAGSVHPDPTATLLAVPVLSAPAGGWARTLFELAAFGLLGWGIAEEFQRRGVRM